MAHGHPDWGEGGIVSTIFKVMDLGELAARLGSIDTFDRRGNVIFQDDFESGHLKWGPYCFGAGSTISYCAETARSGAYCLKLTTGADVGRYSRIYRYMAYPVLGKLGVELAFAIPANPAAFYLTMNLCDGVNEKRGTILYLPSTETLYYRDTSGNYQEVATGLKLFQDTRAWHHLKMVADFVSGKYHRVILDDQLYSLKEHALRIDTSTSYSHLLVEVHAYTEVTTLSYLYLDDLIITQNEG